MQSTVLQYVSLGGIRPDLCLIASFLIGFLVGEFEGVMMGLALGFVQDIFSAGQAGLNLITKGMIGLLAGFAGRHLANATPLALLATLFIVSLLSGLLFLPWGWSGEELANAGNAIHAVVLPQALYDAVVGAMVFWFVAGRGLEDRDFDGGRRVPFGR